MRLNGLYIYQFQLLFDLKSCLDVFNLRQQAYDQAVLSRIGSFMLETNSAVMMVIDSNQLESAKLRAYLSKSPEHYAVLTDYVAMELYKTQSLHGIFKSMEILSEFPKQVVVIKNTPYVYRITGAASEMPMKLIDQSQTGHFTRHIVAMQLAKAGDTRLQREILKLGDSSVVQINKMLADAALLGKSFDDLTKDFTKDERSQIRNNDIYNPPIFESIIQNVNVIAFNVFKNLAPEVNIESDDDFHSTFIFRNTLCMYLLALHWGSVGGAKSARHEKLRNDVIDTHFATYATFYDGLLSDDGKANQIYLKAKKMLEILG